MSDIIDRLYAHSMDTADPTVMDDAAEIIQKFRTCLADIEAAALRNNGPLARDHSEDMLRGIGLRAQFTLKDSTP
jgi:hypothetical protein